MQDRALNSDPGPKGRTPGWRRYSGRQRVEFMQDRDCPMRDSGQAPAGGATRTPRRRAAAASHSYSLFSCRLQPARPDSDGQVDRADPTGTDRLPARTVTSTVIGTVTICTDKEAASAGPTDPPESRPVSSS